MKKGLGKTMERAGLAMEGVGKTMEMAAERVEEPAVGATFMASVKPPAPRENPRSGMFQGPSCPRLETTISPLE
ncbi:MAG: hypothetical protein UZ16_OP3001002122 [Candidatus Hinthialibacteria bacterium OLB16]|nr:MAG: hypothetical protein UZ16_OP3001002122 [Candidatus Hinthialibacteria bacterium OLB16]